jgi:hypothetical protein
MVPISTGESLQVAPILANPYPADASQRNGQQRVGVVVELDVVIAEPPGKVLSSEIRNVPGVFG